VDERHSQAPRTQRHPSSRKTGMRRRTFVPVGTVILELCGEEEEGVVWRRAAGDTCDIAEEAVKKSYHRVERPGRDDGWLGNGR